jgi:transcriptional regulator with XRE-family HTH domain
MLPEVAARIRTIRERAGLTQEALGAALADPDSGKPLTQSAVKNYETRNIPEAHVLLQIAELGRTSVDWILTGRETMAGTVADIFSEQIAEFRQFWTEELPVVAAQISDKMASSARVMAKLADELGVKVEARKLKAPLTAEGVINYELHGRKIKRADEHGKRSAQAGSSRAVPKGRGKGE